MRISLVSIILLALVVGSPLRAADAFKFLAFGDMPYNAKDYNLLKKPGLEDYSLPFAVFYGDMKGGGLKCDADLFIKNRDLIFSTIDQPVFTALGDNGWTDCDRFGDNELSKLSELRTVMYDPNFLPTSRGVGGDWHIQTMPDYPEIMRWRHGNIQFSTLHIVGTNNGRTEINCHTPTDRQKTEKTALDIVDQRDAANIAWLNQVFDEAEFEGNEAEAVVLVMQADPYGDINSRKYVYAEDYKTKCTFNRNAPRFSVDELKALPPCDAENRVLCNPYTGFLSALKRKAEAFGKPVLLIHGSTHDVCVQKQFLGLEGVTRFNGPGDGVSDLAIVSVADGERGPEFEFHLKQEGTQITKACS